MDELPEHVRRNRAQWDQWAAEYVPSAERNWADDVPTWGIWGVPEADVGMLPADLAGKDAIELGCGTAYVSAWMARRGARVVGIDNSAAQLETARRMQRQHGLDFPLIHGNAEVVPYPDASFDFAISEYGACLWADPYRWVPEAARLLRRGGQLVFLTNSFLMMLCAREEANVPATNELMRPAFGMYRVEWPTDPAVEFHLAHGDWVRLLTHSGFDVEDLVEVRPPADAATRYPFVTLEWSRQWPCEEVWKARRRYVDVNVMSRAAFERVVAQFDPHATLVRHWKMKGGISANVTALEIRRADGAMRKLIVRRHGELDRMRNPNITADEFRLLQFLQPFDVAAPTPVHIDTTCTILPTPYFVVDYVDGAIDLREAPADAHVHTMAAQLARIHHIDGNAQAIAFLPPATKTIQWLLEHRPTTPDHSMSEPRIRAALDAAWPWRQHNATTLLHGDFWPGNIVWRDGALVAVLDWEDAECGDPLRDLGITRLDLLWAHGERAMDVFTQHYQSLAQLDMTNLPLWDLCAALRPAGRLAEWAGDAATHQRMLTRHAFFVERAFAALT